MLSLWILAAIRTHGHLHEHLNQNGTIYLNPNINRDEQTRQLYATKNIPMGTIIMIEKPWIEHSLDSESELFKNQYHSVMRQSEFSRDLSLRYSSK